jgi:alanine racemase
MTVSATIHLKALSHNLQIIRSHTSAKIVAMVKANAYGHGLLPVAQFLEKDPLVSMLAVANTEEAILLRQAGIQKDILIMMGFLNLAELNAAMKQACQVVIHCVEQIEVLEKGTDGSISAWLKLDLGMHRLGFSASEAGSAYQRLQACPIVKKPLRFLTHFPSGDEKATAQQAKQFEILTTEWLGEKSLSNSINLLSNTTISNDWVRPGIMLYGVSPIQNKTASDLDLHPVLTLRATVVAIRHLKKGDPIGYDGTWICPEDLSIAIIGIGYGDGYPRSAQSGTPVLIRGQYASLVGRVSMNMIAVDLRGLKILPQVGEEVILWGEGLPVEKIAESAGTIPYELFCRLSTSVKFRYVDDLSGSIF